MNKKVIVLLNMGGIYSSKQVEMFLYNMFNDENILTTRSSMLRRFIAFMIVFFRKKEARGNYEQISYNTPILKYTNILAKKLRDKMGVKVLITMRYTPPFSKKALRYIKRENIRDVFLLPLYPQYSTTTTKSSLEEFVSSAKKNNLDLKICSVDRFYKLESFLELIVQEIIRSKNNANMQEDTSNLIFSAHSLPKKIIKNGDTYEAELNEQVELLSQKLEKKGIKFNKIILAYQSKVTPMEWIGPSLEHILYNLYPINKQKNAIIYPISFAIDNAESVFELSIEYKKIAETLNFDNYVVCGCPNYSDEFVDVLGEVIGG